MRDANDVWSTLNVRTTEKDDEIASLLDDTFRVYARIQYVCVRVRDQTRTCGHSFA